MNIEYHSPNPKCICNSKYPHSLNHCKCNSECICLSNYYSPSSNINIPTEDCSIRNSKTKVTYEISKKEIFSPLRALKKNQSMLFQNISPDLTFIKKNSLFNIRDNANISYKNNLNKNSTNEKKIEPISRYNSTNVLKRKRPSINTCNNSIKSKMNQKDELLQKIRYISKRIDKTINMYREKNYSNLNTSIGKENKYDSNTYNNKKGNNYILNFQYNNSKILDNMRKANNRQSELINNKINNLSQIVTDPVNVYKNIRKNQDSKKIISNYAKLNRQKKFYIDNNINLTKINEKNKKKDL